MRRIGSLRILLLVSFIFQWCPLCSAQPREAINTDRPDQSDGVYTLPKRIFQLETGITAGKTTVAHNFMLRYGITNTTEGRVLINAGKFSSVNGFQAPGLSMKQKLLAQKKQRPAITLAGYLFLEPLAGKSFKGCGYPAELKLAIENEFSEKLSAGYNIGAAGAGNYNLSAVVSYAPMPSISAFAEYFSALSSKAPEHNIDAGLLFALSPVLQLDIAGGRALFSAEERWFITFGVAYRFDR